MRLNFLPVGIFTLLSAVIVDGMALSTAVLILFVEIALIRELRKVFK